MLCGTFLPIYGFADYEPVGFRNAPLFMLAILVALALLVLVSSIIDWCRPLPRWLVTLCLLIVILSLILHLLGSILSTVYVCFDVCPPWGAHMGTGFWLPLAGFLLCVIGLMFVAAAQRREHCTNFWLHSCSEVLIFYLIIATRAILTPISSIGRVISHHHLI